MNTTRERLPERSGHRPVRAVCVGHFTVDRYGTDLCPGGSAYYAARTFLGLGGRPMVITSVGRHFPFWEAWHGMDTSVRFSPNTTAFANRYRPDGTRAQTVFEQAKPLRAREEDRDLLRADVLFLAPVLGELDPTEWISRADARIVALGAQGLLKKAVGRPGRRHRQVAPAVLPSLMHCLDQVHVLFLSREDLSGREGLLTRFCQKVPLVVVTQGADGCDLLQGSSQTHVRAFPATPVDPTGAGDAFAASFLFALARGAPPESAARAGATVAARIVEARAGGNLDGLRPQMIAPFLPPEQEPAQNRTSFNETEELLHREHPAGLPASA